MKSSDRLQKQLDNVRTLVREAIVEAVRNGGEPCLGEQGPFCDYEHVFSDHLILTCDNGEAQSQRTGQASKRRLLGGQLGWGRFGSKLTMILIRHPASPISCRKRLRRGTFTAEDDINEVVFQSSFALIQFAQ